MVMLSKAEGRFNCKKIKAACRFMKAAMSISCKLTGCETKAALEQQ